MLVACQRDRGISPDLATYLADVAALDPDHRAGEIEGWKMEHVWNEIVVPSPFRELYKEAMREFRPPTWNWTGAIATRPHYGGDPELTLNQARARWLLPTLYPSQVATVDGKPIDAVFIFHEGRWFALVGIDRAFRTMIGRYDPECAALIDEPSASKSCRDVAFAVADATLRTSEKRIRRACAIAKTACAKSSP